MLLAVPTSARADDPAAFAARARGCMAGRCDERGECDARETVLIGGDAPAAVLAAGSHATCRPGWERGGSGARAHPALAP